MRYSSVDLNEEWVQIERMVQGGLTPSAERIKEYLQASCVKGNTGTNDTDKVILCISDILRSDEETCSRTDPGLMDILVVLEASRSSQELKQIFLGSPV